MNEETSFVDIVGDAIVEQISKHVNLPHETEALIEAALYHVVVGGVDAARKLAQALRERVSQDAV